MRFFCAEGTSHFIQPFMPSGSSFTNMSASVNTIFSSPESLKKVFRSVPSDSRMSVSVAIEGEVRSRSKSDIKPLESSQRFASSSCVSPRCILSLRMLFPISKQFHLGSKF